jgi:hypothetical protein
LKATTPVGDDDEMSANFSASDVEDNLRITRTEFDADLIASQPSTIVRVGRSGVTSGGSLRLANKAHSLALRLRPFAA